MTYWIDRAEPRQTYPQQWHEYNLSQTSEKLMFMDMLRELSGYLEVKKSTGRGRPSLNVQEMVYCMGLLIYCGKSSRRTISELHISKDRHLISQVPHFNSILNHFNEKSLSKKLQALITLSSMPLKCVEKDFAVDSTGFTTSVFGRWFDHKWGKKNDHRLWRKAHVMTGVKTNIITSIEVTKGTSADINEFPTLVEKTSEQFQLREVSADMAYTSRENMNLVSSKGAIPFIPFKSNATGNSKGSMVWKRMFQYFQEHYDEYMQHYHKRSNVETTFSMIKRKFGMHLRSKSDTAQENEILCKALCHNIVVLIHETFELGLNTEFEPHLSAINCAALHSAQKTLN
ncbi:transposase [Candidatus Woesearchaeota archaeon]|nr:transposase [Candidatus Woesearchaeota archaeon]